MKKAPITRRSFIHKSYLATSSVLLGAASVRHSWARYNSPNDTLVIGVIGTGGREGGHLRMLKHLIEEGENIMAGIGMLYEAQCWSLDVSYMDGEDERKYLFLINLHGIGGIGSDISGSSIENPLG